MSQNRLLSDKFAQEDDEEAERLGVKKPMRLTSQNYSCLYYFGIAAAVLLFISAAVAFGLVIFEPETFTLLNPVANLRYQREGSPTANLIAASNVLGTINIGLVAAATSALGFVAFVLVIFFHDAQVGQMQAGANPFIWIHMFIWHVPAFVTYAAVVSAPLFELILIPGLALGWLALFYLGDLRNSFQDRLAAARANARGYSTYPWVAFLLAALLFVFVVATFATNIIQALTAGSRGFSSEQPVPTFAIPTEDGIIPIIGIALYALVPIVIALYTAGVLITSTFLRDITLYVIVLLFILVTTWLPIIVFAFDNLESI